jgi:hypothetical protein
VFLSGFLVYAGSIGLFLRGRRAEKRFWEERRERRKRK